MRTPGPKEAQQRALKAARVAPADKRTATAKKIVEAMSPDKAKTYATRLRLAPIKKLLDEPKATVPDTMPKASLPVTDKTTKSKTSKPSGQTKIEPTAKPAAEVKQESIMKPQTAKTTKRSVSEAAANLRAAKAKAPKAKGSKAKATANARKPVGDKQPSGMAEKIGKLASRPEGASRAELIKLSGWEKQAWKWYFVNSKDSGFCQRFGYKLEVIDKEGEPTRYKITKK